MTPARARIAAGCACALTLLATRGSARLIWNATASAPIGLYLLVRTVPLRRGELVLAMPPAAARRLAAHRGYLPDGVALIKHVAAVSGDRICSTGRVIAINGTVVAVRLNIDSRNRPLPAWRGCRTLADSQVFLLNATVSHSFDGRYFGPSPASSVLGKLVPLWMVGIKF